MPAEAGNHLRIVVNKFCLLILSCFVVNGCSKYASNAESVYLQSRNAAVVDVPPPLTGSNIGHFYDLPEQKQQASVSIEPPLE